MMKSALIVLLAVLALPACGFIDDMKDMMEKGQVASKALKDSYGWSAQVAAQKFDGKLAVVTVMLSAKEVREQRVAALEDAVNEVVARVFQGKPETLLVQIASGALEH
jgi:major membrane immunogen (membrane-anchored lipoprotein)